VLRPRDLMGNVYLCAAVGRSAFRRATCRSFLGRFLPRLGPLSQAAFFFAWIPTICGNFRGQEFSPKISLCRLRGIVQCKSRIG